jgi:hypothetical protein
MSLTPTYRWSRFHSNATSDSTSRCFQSQSSTRAWVCPCLCPWACFSSHSWVFLLIHSAASPSTHPSACRVIRLSVFLWTPSWVSPSTHPWALQVWARLGSTFFTCGLPSRDGLPPAVLGWGSILGSGLGALFAFGGVCSLPSWSADLATIDQPLAHASPAFGALPWPPAGILAHCPCSSPIGRAMRQRSCSSLLCRQR